MVRTAMLRSAPRAIPPAGARSTLPVALTALAIAVAACSAPAERAADAADGSTSDAAAPVRADTTVIADSSRIARLDETYVTPLDTLDNIDSPVFWHGPNGEHWLIATAKATDVLVVYDAATGAPVRRASAPGTGGGEIERPNGIAVIPDSAGDWLLVVERDNHRVQGFSLPDFRPLGIFGAERLRKPYGIAWYRDTTGEAIVYVTDNYETPQETIPPDAELGERVQVWRARRDGDVLTTTFVRAFGDTTAAGAIRTIESIGVDPRNDRLLIAEETETDSHVKVYDLAGRFTGRIIGRGLFPQQAEGLALYACADGAGYWIATDQGDDVNTFHVFDRATLAYAGSFSGAVTRRTDGVALTQTAFGPFPAGAFAGAHLDAGLGVLSWAAIAEALGLRGDCPAAP